MLVGSVYVLLIVCIARRRSIQVLALILKQCYKRMMIFLHALFVKMTLRFTLRLDIIGS